MNTSAGVFAVSCTREHSTGADALQREQQLNRFLAEVERRALRIAEIGVRDRDEALDLVQEAMIKLVRNYSDRPDNEWAPLFYRILQNGVRDWHRRQKVRNRVMVWFGKGAAADDDYDVTEGTVEFGQSYRFPSMSPATLELIPLGGRAIHFCAGQCRNGFGVTHMVGVADQDMADVAQ